MSARASANLLGVALLCVGGLVACTNDKGATNNRPNTGSATASAVSGAQQVTISAGDDYRFHPSTITVHPGKVRIVLKHPGTGGPHNWQLPQFPADFVPLTAAGQTSKATFTAPSPGRYQFICTIHVRQGQRGTLIVTPK
jgi:plastocyanin